MMVVRATQRLRRYLPPIQNVDLLSDRALGDWYGNRLVVDRQPLLLLMNAETLLTILLPARDLKTLPQRLSAIVAARLRRLNMPPEIIERETKVSAPARIAVTLDRSLLGSLTQFTQAVPQFLPSGGWDETSLPFVEARLANTPCRAGRRRDEVIWPARDSIRILVKWWAKESWEHRV